MLQMFQASIWKCKIVAKCKIPNHLAQNQAAANTYEPNNSVRRINRLGLIETAKAMLHIDHTSTVTIFISQLLPIRILILICITLYYCRIFLLVKDYICFNSLSVLLRSAAHHIYHRRHTFTHSKRVNGFVPVLLSSKAFRILLLCTYKTNASANYVEAAQHNTKATFIPIIFIQYFSSIKVSAFGMNGCTELS